VKDLVKEQLKFAVSCGLRYKHLYLHVLTARLCSALLRVCEVLNTHRFGAGIQFSFMTSPTRTVFEGHENDTYVSVRTYKFDV
jgi:hypothetical protein